MEIYQELDNITFAQFSRVRDELIKQNFQIAELKKENEGIMIDRDIQDRAIAELVKKVSILERVLKLK